MKHKNDWLIVIGSFLLFAIFIGFIIYNFVNAQIRENTNIDEYESTLKELKENSDAHSLLYIFPDSVNKDNVLEYKYAESDGLFDGSYLFYLVEKYNEENFNNEVERLNSIKVEFKEETKSILYTEEGFNYPAYVTIYDNNGTSEYALVNKEDSTIIYVFMQLFNESDSNIDEKYFPVDYHVNKKDTKRDGYNMYYHFYKNGDGYMFGEKPLEK